MRFPDIVSLFRTINSCVLYVFDVITGKLVKYAEKKYSVQ